MDTFFGPAGSDKRIFSHYWEVQLFAASVAFQRGLKEDLPDKNGTDIDYDTFKPCGYWAGFLNCIALVDSGNPDHLLPEYEEYRISLFERYAESGLRILDSEGFGEFSESMFARKLTEDLRAPDRAQ